VNAAIQVRFRPLGRGSSWGGITATVLVHISLLAMIYFGHVKASLPIEAPRDMMVTRLVSLGKPRDKFWLPRIVHPPRPQAPPRVLKLTHNPNTAAALKEAPRQEDAELAKEVRHALKRAELLSQDLAPEETPEGSLTGSPEGTSTQGSSGDAYATAIYMAIRKNWNTPAGLVTDTELQGLLAEVHISIGEEGTLTNPQVRKPSGNQYFDESCLQAIRATGKVPPPPADQRARFQYGALLEFSGKDLAQ
jgi:TonB family protein